MFYTDHMLHNFNSCNFKKNYFLFMAIFLLAGTVHSERKMVKRQKRNPPSQVKEAVHDIPDVPEGILKIRKAYKNLDINVTYNKELKDWCMHFSSYGKEFKFYWCDGAILPEEELSEKKEYWSLLYPYPENLRDPVDMTESEKLKLKEFGSVANRRQGKGSAMYFFDAVYDSGSRKRLESHLQRISFLGKNTTIHEQIVEPVKNVEKKIKELSLYDSEVKTFVEKIKSCDAFAWRVIDGTNRKSFHSLGIAIDILPVRITGEIFWSWARDKNPENWMLTPLSRRWLPPKKVVQIFEEEGFIWGGKWGIWDNMHFEYHPELLPPVSSSSS